MDLNNDGFKDILSGSYSWDNPNMAGTFHVLWGTEDGFKKPYELPGTDNKALVIPAGDGDDGVLNSICTRPTATDWDGDGDLDLIVGNFGGTFFVFSGEGEGKFYPEPQQVMAGDEPLVVEGMHSDPFVVDFDGDGDMDLFSGSAQGGVFYAENTAGAGNTPVFSGFETMIEPAGYSESAGGLVPTAPAGSTRVWVDDINGDGKLDLLVGDSAMLSAPVEGLSEEELAEREAAWQAEMEGFFERFESMEMNEDGEPADMAAYEALIAEYQAHYEARSEFIIEESTGFVWLYLQQ